VAPALPRLQPLLRTRVASLGEAGARWHAALPATLDALAADWHLDVRRPLPGGSAAYVVGVRDHHGHDLVLKVALPEDDLSDQGRVLATARGRGYARLHAHDPARHALLMEHLGDSLDRASLEPEPALDLLVDTLGEAWAGQSEPGPGGPDKAAALGEMVRDLDAALGGPTDPRVMRTALDHAERLAGWGGRRVVAHGDPHPANLLRAPDGRGTGWVFVDPDGLAADPAYDAGVLLRDWCRRLQGTGARSLLAAWCARVADRAGLDFERVWAWAFLERVSTGLYVTSFGAERVGRPYLDSARALL